MAISKVTLNGTTLMDATAATASAEEIIAPYTAMTADGVMTTGTGTGGGDINWDDYISGTYPNGTIALNTTTTIPNWFFAGSTGITGIESNSVTAIGLSTDGNGRSFMNCTGLSTVSMPNCIYFADRTFQGCSNLTSISFPELLTIGRAGTDNHAFDGCSKLSLIHFPKLTRALGVGAFWGIGSSSNYCTIVLPAVTTSISSFRSSYIEALDIGPDCTSSLDNYNFYMGQYRNLILRPTRILAALDWSSISSLDANTTIYLPKTLYDELGTGSALDYKAATNWSAIADTVQWAQIEGSYYESHYADGTEIPSA